jgi:hypothetical protein
MDVKAGTTVGFTTVVGGLGGAIAGFFLAEAFYLKNPDRITQAAAALGALTGAFVGGTLVAATPPTAPTTALVAPTPAALPVTQGPAQLTPGSTTSNK